MYEILILSQSNQASYYKHGPSYLPQPPKQAKILSQQTSARFPKNISQISSPTISLKNSFPHWIHTDSVHLSSRLEGISHTLKYFGLQLLDLDSRLVNFWVTWDFRRRLGQKYRRLWGYFGKWILEKWYPIYDDLARILSFSPLNRIYTRYFQTKTPQFTHFPLKHPGNEKIGYKKQKWT